MPVDDMAHWRNELNKGVARRDFDSVLKALDEIIKLEPLEYRNYSAKVSVLRMKKDSDGVIATRRAAAEALAGSADGLNEVAWDLVTEEDLALRDPALALKCAEESVRLSERKEAASLDTLARAWYDLGMLDKAIELQKESLAAAANADERADVKKALVYYESVLKAREQATKDHEGDRP
jgi:tetratricopeptide (TPR) repeat protein